jgi:hypothetical protein
VIGAPVSCGERAVREVNQEIQAWVEATVSRLEPPGSA